MKIKMIEKNIYLFIILIGLIFMVLFILFFSNKRRNDSLYVEYTLEKTIATLMDAQRDHRLNQLLLENDQILGFGIYRRDGKPILFKGTAPKRLDFLMIDRFGSPQYDRSQNSIVLMRLLDIKPRLPKKRMSRGMDHKMPLPPGSREKFKPRVVFIEMRIKSYFQNRTLFRYTLLLFPLLFILILILFMITLQKNQKYKKEINKQAQLARLGEVSRTLSHEIKNPLGAIKLQVAYLKKILTPQQAQELRVIDEEVERLRLLTSRIGDFLRDPAGRPGPVNIDRFIRDMLQKYHTQNIRYQNTNPDLPLIQIDQQRLYSILENIIQNALESYGELALEPEPELIIRTNKKYVMLHLLDYGKGLPLDYEKKIFDPYFTTKTKGSGIGLAITRRFIEAVQGKIELKPRPEKGTETILYFPRQPQ